MVERKTPAVYVQEIPGFTNSVVEVETAVPAFIGYTEFAAQGVRSLTNTPFRISSFFDYVTFFGGAPITAFDLVQGSGGAWVATAPNPRHYLYYAMRLFFDNGGGACYIVSVGDYAATISKDDLNGGIQLLEGQPEPTMVVIPDGMSLAPDDAIAVQQQMLFHCSKMASRVAILDLYGGDLDLRTQIDPKSKTANKTAVDFFRDGVGVVGLDFGAVYYPWIETSLLSLTDLNVGYLTASGLQALAAVVRPAKVNGAALSDVVAQLAPWLSGPQGAGSTASGTSSTASGTSSTTAAAGSTAVTTTTTATKSPPAPAIALKQLAPGSKELAQQALAHATLLNLSSDYQNAMNTVLAEVNKAPPSGAMAGVYTRTDSTRGVFKAPAGTSIMSAVAPVVTVTDDDQQDLNVPLDGKAINAIRAIPGWGVMVWGARTLNGNSQDTRYINVRRTMIMLEQSIKAAMQAFMFEPNTPNTWVSVESMISSFLLNQWKAGALLGSTPTDAFSVSVGLGLTMTADDILDGYLNVLVKVAIVRPAEFIVLTFQQTMPTA
jgi:phage tail sheath protein FI